MNMPKIIDYRIVSAGSTSGLAGLEELVRLLLQENWQPWGGPYFDSFAKRHCQALVQYAKEAE